MCRAEVGRQIPKGLTGGLWCFEFLFEIVCCFAHYYVVSLTVVEVKFNLDVFDIINVLSRPPPSSVEW